MTPECRDYVVRFTVAAGLVATFVLAVGVGEAAAIPAWARKYDVTCTTCHTAWPSLNSLGREFKMLGYRLPGERDNSTVNTDISEALTLDQMGVRLLMRPFDKKRNEDGQIRSFHEIEIFFAGPISRDFSIHAELEAEDEEEFNVSAPTGVMGWHPANEANIAMGWAPPFFSDPFNTLVDGGRRMTRSHKGPLDERFDAGERLRSASQWVGFYGYAGDRVFYNGGASAGGDDPEGEDAKDVFGRVMVETLPGLNVGGFILDGTNETQAAPLDFRRTGIDVQLERGDLNLYGMLLHAKDDLLAGGDVSNTVGYVEGFYTFDTSAIPLVVPLVRIDFMDEFTNLTSNINFYLTENIKAYLEWWQNLDTPAGLEKDNRVTVQVDFAF